MYVRLHMLNVASAVYCTRLISIGIPYIQYNSAGEHGMYHTLKPGKAGKIDSFATKKETYTVRRLREST